MRNKLIEYAINTNVEKLSELLEIIPEKDLETIDLRLLLFSVERCYKNPAADCSKVPEIVSMLNNHYKTRILLFKQYLERIK